MMYLQCGISFIDRLMYRMNLQTVSTIIMLVAACAATPTAIQTDTPERPFSIGISGNTADTVTTPIPLIFLGGGSTDQDNAMTRFLQAASGGDVTVIRASGSTGYNAYMMGLADIHSAETYLITDRVAASNSKMNLLISNSEALFVAGGDQWNYTQFWEGTALDATVRQLTGTKRIPFGGTSAGAMIWGGRFFDAAKGSITSEEALTNPFDEKLSLRPGLFGSFPILRNWIVDTHFSERNREGRLMAFMARAMGPGYTPGGIAIDEKTAFIIDSDGVGTAYGLAQVWIYIPDSGLGGPESLTTGSPLTWNRAGKAVRVWKLSNGDRFDLNSLRPLDRPAGYYASVVNGVFSITADDE